MSSKETKNEKAMGGAFLVGVVILSSRIACLVRERVFAHYFGQSWVGDAFRAALKIPNFLQNLFGEGVLSASFIPVYSGLLGKNQNEEAGRIARAVGTLLGLMVSIVVLLGVIATPVMIDWIAPGFTGERRELTIRLVRIFFPGTGFLVLSAWCLGVLNSHRKFFLSYTAPVLWNVVIIATMLVMGKKTSGADLVVWTAWGLVLGSLAQFMVQLPWVYGALRSLSPNFSFRNESVRTILRNFGPVVLTRGVVQMSAYLDNMIASLLPIGSVSALSYAQTISLLPVSLFGMSVSAAQLPELSRETAQGEQNYPMLLDRITKSSSQMSFYVIPSATAMFVFGRLMAAALFQTGAFTAEDSLRVGYVLMASSVGLWSSTQGRLLSSVFYALKDTRRPLAYASLRIFVVVALGLVFAFPMKGGVVGLILAASLAGILEYQLLRLRLSKVIGAITMNVRENGERALFSFVAAGLGWSLWHFMLAARHPIVQAALVFSVYGICYLGLAWLRKEPEAMRISGRLARFVRR